MTSFAVIGANGQLGHDLMKNLAAAGHEPRPLTHADIEVTDAQSVKRALGETAADVVINTAAMSVESSERDPDKAFAVNATACRNLADATSAAGSRLVQISTDYVFDGEKAAPYIETDPVRPINTYGVSKLAGEFFVLAGGGRNCVVRTSGLYGAAGCRSKNGMNFVTTMLKLAAERDTLSVVADEVMTPTYTADLARQLLAICEAGITGVVHATSAGSCSWFEFTQAIVELAGADLQLSATTGSEFAADAEVPIRRPSFTVLENRRLAEAGIDLMSDWRDALGRYLNEIG